MIKKYIISLFLIIPTLCFGDDCLDYKLTPKVKVNIPSWSKQVVQPLQKMDILHGDVIATMVDNYDLITDITSIEDGFCLSLKRVEATIGYSDFLVQIDISHKPNTCSYNAILQHEDEHIRSYLSLIDDNKKAIEKAITSAANSINPVFVKSKQDMESAIDKLNDELQKHPDIILLKQHLKAEEEIRNKRVDQNDTGETLKKCFL